MKPKYVYTLIALGLLSVGNVFAQDAAATEVAIQTVPNYASNYKLFIALSLLTLFLLLAIFIVAGNIKSVLRSDFYKEKLMKMPKQGTNSTLLGVAILMGTFFVGNSASALTFNPENGKAGLPWLKVENSDLFLLLGLNIVMLFVFFYLKRMFKQILSDVGLAKEKEKAQKASKLNVILTDAVPIENEDTILLEDEYDGIRELDNNLPPWWVAMLIASMIFAVVYVFHYHIFKTGDLQIAEYTKDVAKSEIAKQEYLSKMAMNVDETNATVMTDAGDLDAGKTLYQNNCVVCHGDKGQGDIGPNLSDDYWLYTGDIKAIFGTIKKGTSNGMPEHESKLNPIQIQQVASFVYNLPFATGKEPEGQKYTK
ncbi:MAG TPA: cbb3-type cytochrome c oxidase N-terminal domain-containing protein [Crocinitomicaceae bacterium]|nr:cbb3-type cytochrome c oxidase N-terminal domain-containing protein [Crocinitomicaceae bacterium]